MQVIKNESTYTPPPVESVWLKLEEGTTTLRILSHSVNSVTHFVKSEKKSHDCTGEVKTCQYCQKNNKPRQQWAYLVLLRNEKNPTIKVAKFGWSIFKTILDLSKDKDYGDPRSYDVKIKRVGQDLDTEYTVIPGKDFPYNDQEMAILMPEDLVDPEKATAKLLSYYKKEGETAFNTDFDPEEVNEIFAEESTKH